MLFTLEEFLENCFGFERLSIYNEKENIQDIYVIDEIPDEWLIDIVKSFTMDFNSKTLCIDI